MAEPEQQVRPDEQARGPSEPEEAEEGLVEALRRERADFVNYKRRVERERAEDRDRGGAEVVQRLLPLLDELDRALAQVPEDLETHPWVRGVVMARRLLIQALDDLGVERIGAEGEHFDPARHEAVFYDARPDAAEPRVATVIRPGYALRGRLLRPAQVSVVGPAEASPDHGAQDDGAQRHAAAQRGQKRTH
jgi:molecular chaperone GrpE